MPTTDPFVPVGALAGAVAVFGWLRWATREERKAELALSAHKDAEIAYYKAEVEKCRDEMRMVRAQLRAIMLVARANGWVIPDELTG